MAPDAPPDWGWLLDAGGLLDAVEVVALATVLGWVVTDTGLLVAVIGAIAVEAGADAWWTGGSLSSLTLVTVTAWW